MNLAVAAECREKLGALGICAKLVAAIKAFPMDRDMQYWGTGAVVNLSEGNASNTTMLAAAGVCEVFLRGLVRFSADRDVQLHGCLAACNLATEEDSAKALMSAGTEERLEAALAAFPADREIKSSAQKALRILRKVKEEVNKRGRDEAARAGGKAKSKAAKITDS